MAPLYGRLQGNRGEATRMGFEEITAKLETWTGSVTVELRKNGEFAVFVGDKHGLGEQVLRGNVDERIVYERVAGLMGPEGF